MQQTVVPGGGTLRGNSVDAQAGTGRAERGSRRKSPVAVSVWSTGNQRASGGPLGGSNDGSSRVCGDDVVKSERMNCDLALHTSVAERLPHKFPTSHKDTRQLWLVRARRVKQCAGVLGLRRECCCDL
ncbi:hypothetical protein HBH56_034280 [Parastagonospora nodorum]|nr:hypothetical protein HBH56_034280 [Parastagonospora nodorum]KAH3952548.1 hypothetical protein HBH53_044890 [Parastagonospora nodorum]KAH3979533.1 hypothetical protein HBH51_055920 [Parastagonospora nodorum]KAH3979985.1 hypothetical protein HBH52_092070 [Parastagonospora nodorum]KAH4031819.1 hypothetical protein HBI13_016000 [Parastagonospora nodorum]